MRFFPWPSGIDPDAAAVIAAVGSHVSVSGAQQAAIDAFFRAGKTDGWFSSLKRLYLPIWANSSANAIDWIQRGSGTFHGTVTHSAGHVESNGTNGYFDTLAIPSTQGITLESASVFWLLYGASALASSSYVNTYYGGRPGATTGWLSCHTSTAGVVTRQCSGNNTGYGGGSLDVRGILMGNRNTTTHEETHRRTSSGALLDTNAVASVTLPTMKMFAMAASLNNSPAVYANSAVKFGAYGHGLGMATADAPKFTLALKTLWETCTGLSLP
jgi:hypothetical protein